MAEENLWDIEEEEKIKWFPTDTDFGYPINPNKR